jgi:hypothetical protein
MKCTSSISHNVKSLYIPMSHIIRSHARLPHLYHAAHHFLTANWWVCPLYALASSNFVMTFRLMKECVAYLSTHETFLPLIWASRYKRLGLGLRRLALATKPTSNIYFMATTWFVFVPQGNFLTFGLQSKHDFPRYRKTIILHRLEERPLLTPEGGASAISGPASQPKYWMASKIHCTTWFRLRHAAIGRKKL